MLFFERDLEVYISTVTTGFTTDNTIKIASMPGSSITYKNITRDYYNYKIEEAPNRNKEKTIIGFSNPSFKFSTYAKPYNDTTNDTAVEKLLLYSLTGNMGTEAPTNYTTSFVSLNKLPELYVYVKFNNLVYYISSAVVKDAEYSFDLNEILKINWNLIGLAFDRVDVSLIPGTYTDYTTVQNFIKCNYAQLSISYDVFNDIPKDMIVFNGKDAINYGTDSSSFTFSGGITFEDIAGVKCYDIADSNASSNRINFPGVLAFSGAPYPNANYKTYFIEMLVYYDGTVDGSTIYMFSSANESTFYIKMQTGNITVQDSLNCPLRLGNHGASTFNLTTLGLDNTWVHFAMEWNGAEKTTHFFLNGVPYHSAWYDSTRNLNFNTSSSGLILGNGIGSDPFYCGYISNIAVSWGNQPTGRYWETGYTDYDTSVDADTIFAISSDLSDDGPNGYTISDSTGFSDAGTYISGPEGSIKTLSIDVDSDYGTNQEEWSIELEFNYGRSGATYGGLTIFDDGVRKLSISSNVLYAAHNNTNRIRDNYWGSSTYSQSLPKNTWHRVLFERKDNIIYMYLNGLLRGTYPTTSQNALPTSGTINLMSAASDMSLHFRNLRISRGAKKTPSYPYKSKWLTDTSVNIKLPIISGSVSLKNKVEVAERNTLDQRNITKLDHYVQERETEIDIVGYTKTGSSNTKSNIELFQEINANSDFSTIVDKPVELIIGKSDEANITFTLPRAQIELPEIKIDDVITSNITISGQRQTVDNDDISIKYKT